MSQLKKVLITLPEQLVDEIDRLAEAENKERSDIVRDVMKSYFSEKHKHEIASELAQGYLEMSEINLGLARECFDADEENLRHYEEKIAECE